MTDPGLIRRAEAAGISTSYENWLGEPAEVAADTLEAILAALTAAPASGPDQAGTGQTGTDQAGNGRAAGAAAGAGPGASRIRPVGSGPAPGTPAGAAVLGVYRPAVLRPVPAVLGAW